MKAWVTVSLTEAQWAALNRLADERGVSVDSIITNALRGHMSLADEVRAGNRLLLQGTDRSVWDISSTVAVDTLTAKVESR